MSDGNSKLRPLVPVLPSTHLLKLLFLTRYVNCSLERSAVLLASPRGEVASRSDDGEGLCVSQLNIATLPSARKARSHLPFQGRYNDILKL